MHNLWKKMKKIFFLLAYLAADCNVIYSMEMVHEKVTHTENPYQCSMCPNKRRFKTIPDLEQHNQLCHDIKIIRALIINITKNSTQEESKTCPLCHKKFEQFGWVITHLYTCNTIAYNATNIYTDLYNSSHSVFKKPMPPRMLSKSEWKACDLLLNLSIPQNSHRNPPKAVKDNNNNVSNTTFNTYTIASSQPHSQSHYNDTTILL